jgi:ribokinase
LGGVIGNDAKSHYVIPFEMSEADKTWDVVVVGGANTDYMVRGPRLPRPGETVQGDEFLEAPGGKGANQAVAAARLGARVAFIARVGADARGQAAIAQLQREGVDVRGVARDAHAFTGVALVMVDQRGEKQIFAAGGANVHFTPQDVRAAADTLRRARVVLTQLEVRLDAVTIAVQLAREAGVRVVLDPAPPQPLADELLRQVDLLKPDAREAEALTQIPVRDRASARAAANRLLERGVGAVAVQAGEEGDLIVWRGGERFLPRFPVKSVDATGAGDAFAAALAVALAEGRSLEEAGPFASAAAALTTTKLGAQAALPDRAAVMALLASRHQK